MTPDTKNTKYCQGNTLKVLFSGTKSPKQTVLLYPKKRQIYVQLGILEGFTTRKNLEHILKKKLGKTRNARKPVFADLRIATTDYGLRISKDLHELTNPEICPIRGLCGIGV